MLDSATDEQPQRKILLVEDSVSNQRIAGRMLERLGFEFDSAMNGKEAVEAVARRRYDAVLMDCMLPVMDGYEATRQIRRQYPTPHIPIIALTANAMAGDRAKCLAAGMDDYLSKPINKGQLGEILAKWVAPTDALGTARQPRLHTADTAGVPATVDRELLEELGFTGSSSDDGPSLALLFAEGVRERLADMYSALTDGDSERLGHAAHDLKGSAANVGAEILKGHAIALETIARDDQLAGGEMLVRQAEEECTRVIEALTAIEADDRRAA